MITRMTFDFEVTDRQTWPSNFGRVTVEVDKLEDETATYLDAFRTAYAMVYGLRGVEMVTSLDLVL